MVSKRIKQTLFLTFLIVYCASVFVVIHEVHKIERPVTEVAVLNASEEPPTWVYNVGSHCFEMNISIDKLHVLLSLI